MKFIASTLLFLVALPLPLAAARADAAHLLLRQDGQAMVTEVRTLALPKGAGTLLLPGLPTAMDPSSLRLRSKTTPAALAVESLAVDAEGANPARLLRDHVGREVEALLPEGAAGVRKRATVLAATEPPLLLIDGAVYAGPVTAVIYPAGTPVPPPLPSATALVRNAGPRRQEVELTYLARDISWRMDYALTLPAAGGRALLEGRAALDNHSGKDFAPAEVELLAGETNGARNLPMRAMMAVAAPKFPGVESQEVFEQHLYHLPRAVNLPDKRTLLVPLFAPARVEVSRRLVGQGQALNAGQGPLRERLNVVLSFRNNKAQGLGLALPSGPLRVYEERDGATRLVGEARLDRQAVGQTAEFSAGSSFDVNVERVAKDMAKTGEKGWRGSWELRVRNSGKTARRVVLQEQIPGAWKVERASGKWRKASASVLEFELEVPPTGDGAPLTVSYTFSTEL